MKNISNQPVSLFSQLARSAGRVHYDLRNFFSIFLFGGLTWILVLSIASYWNGGSFLTMLGTLGMFSAAALIVGALFGFLFGIPRVLASDATAPAQGAQPIAVLPNTNLEQISDWLTKVLVGVGLAEIKDIYRSIGRLSSHFDLVFASALPGRLYGGPVAVATLVTFGTCGFLWAYFESRTSLFLMFGGLTKPGNSADGSGPDATSSDTNTTSITAEGTRAFTPAGSLASTAPQ